ncbi:hypothetical protein [Saccharopolyspora spinosa]|nr:hypothetical protein [Saccharopolyspora spinosa]
MNGNGGMGSGMMPPMMPPMGGMGGMGGGNDQKERERQTWLSEDDEVWGANDAAGLSVIGRPDEEGYEFDESIVAAGPIRGPRQPAPQPAEDEQEAETATRNA